MLDRRSFSVGLVSAATTTAVGSISVADLAHAAYEAEQDRIEAECRRIWATLSKDQRRMAIAAFRELLDD